jgi:plasmid maintenance system antidote protein VapI
VCEGTGIAAGTLAAPLHGTASVDAAVVLRLARYFGVSEGFFLRLQNDYDLEEVRRSRGTELDRIVPRAA